MSSQACWSRKGIDVPVSYPDSKQLPGNFKDFEVFFFFFAPLKYSNQNPASLTLSSGLVSR
jgi:hypothetical protein